jgi:ribosome-associated toxin RatA of RatAB toxin-antitoxin module
MTRTTNSKKLVSIKALTTMSAIIVIASVVMITVWQIPKSIAASLEQLRVSHKISAPVDQVWNIVSDVDNDAKYWSTFKNIKNINKTDNIIEREVTITAGLQDAKTHQFVTVNPELRLIQTNITEGPVTGTRVLVLSPSSDSNATKIDVLWNIDMSSIPAIVRGFAKDSFMKTTEEALNRIAQIAE